MKAGDLVTLSSYSMKSEPMWMVRKKVWEDKKPLLGLVLRIEENPYLRPWTSKNEGKFYYIQWMQDYGPISRFGNNSYYRGKQGYFLRNDLKFVK